MIFAMTFGFVAVSTAQAPLKEPVGLNFYNIPGSSVEVRSVEEHCKVSADEGTCTMSIRYQSEVFPMYFIQGTDTLEKVMSADSSIGFEAIQGVKYKVLPNGGLRYMLEIRNPRGGTYITTTIGS